MFTNINKRKFNPNRFALLDLGFRIFFLSAAIFSVISIIFWMAIYGFQVTLSTYPLTSFQWHAHEMIYGYAMAVIAGFLLTAIMNWTGIQTVRGVKLLILALFWFIARISLLFGGKFLVIAFLFDMLFGFFLVLSVSIPIIRSKNWKQVGIITKVLLLILGNLTFYLGTLGYISRGVSIGIYGGLYIIISLILTIGSRVVPMFIRNFADDSAVIKNQRWITVASLILMVALTVNELFLQMPTYSSFFAAGLFSVNTVRLYDWYDRSIWKNPLLWSLYIALGFIDIGFLLIALSTYIDISKFIALHALTYGGIGIITLSMMIRVTLGHTGRSVREVGRSINYIMALLVVGSIVRVFLPLFVPRYYLFWIISSQVFWIISFLLFIFDYGKMLCRPRIDGQPG